MAQLNANGIAIEYDEIGDKAAPAFLLIMGFGTQMTSWPDAFRQGLADAGFRVIRFDNRDVGLTQKFSGLPNPREVSRAMAEGRMPDVPYTLDDMADDGAAILDALGIESAHVAGASMGGMIAQLMALRHPSRVRSLISIMSTTGDPSLPRSDPAAQEALMARPPAEDKASVVAHGVKTRKVITGRRYPTEDHWLAETIAANYERSYYPQGTVRQWAAILASGPRTSRLKRLSLPALVLHGGDDTLIKPEAGRHTAASIPGATYVEIEGWGHDMAPSVIPVLLETMVPFLRGVEAERAEALSRPVAPGCCGGAAGQ
ncbi:MAG: alpha/beta hydrolase [Alphaproteobacteria bacterium]|nr:alpha/beta hydrolase [Alphaproteobacteria bacterium]